MFHGLLARAITLNSDPQPRSFLKSSSFASSMDQPLACLALSYRCDPPPTKHRLLHPRRLALIGKPCATTAPSKNGILLPCISKVFGFIRGMGKKISFFWTGQERSEQNMNMSSPLEPWISTRTTTDSRHWHKVISLQRTKWGQPRFSVTLRYLPRWLTPMWASKPSAVLEYGPIIVPALLIRIWSCFSSVAQPLRPCG